MAANHIPVAAVARRVTFFQPADKDAFAEKPNSAVAVNNINVTPQRVRIVVISETAKSNAIARSETGIKVNSESPAKKTNIPNGRTRQDQPRLEFAAGVGD